MYEGLVTGQVATFGDSEQEESNDSMAILDRIESAEGEILFQPEPAKKQVIDAKVSLAIGSILENVVKFGTGRGATQEVALRSDGEGAGAQIADMKLAVPLLGKTGTANNYTNASFFGYLPEVTENGVAMTLRDGYAVGVYVGYDNNDPMRRKSSRISGSAGALPAWSRIASVLLHEQDYVNRLDPVDLSFYGLAIKRDELGQLNVAVEPEQGGKVIEPVAEVSEIMRSQPSVMTFGSKTEAGRFIMERNFQPFWKTAAEAGQ
jgi:membrane peptidoglycan carboxypeptidase